MCGENSTSSASRTERPPGSGIWWINYYEHGKQRREKVGNKSAAISLYRKRKTEILAGKKLPELKRIAPVMVADLIDEMLTYVKNQGHRDQRTYESRGRIVRLGLGDRDARGVTSLDIETWLNEQTKSAATSDRYKSLISLTFKLGVRNKKVADNPARGVFISMRKESRGRLRFLSRDEYIKLHQVIAERFPEHLAEFVASVHTGLRLSEQYTVEAGQFDRTRRVIDLDRTKNGDARTVHLNADALAAVESVIQPIHKRSDRLFRRMSRADVYTLRKRGQYDNRSWFTPAVIEAGIPRITWHGLRHTFCSWLAMAGATTREIMEAAGHKTMSQAARYSHLSPQHAQSVVDRIAGTCTEISNMHQAKRTSKARGRRTE